MEYECDKCHVTVIDKGLVIPFNTDGTPHMECFGERFVFVRVQ